MPNQYSGRSLTRGLWPEAGFHSGANCLNDVL